MTPKELATYQKMLNLLRRMEQEVGVANFQRGELEATIFQDFRVGLSADGHSWAEQAAIPIHQSGVKQLIVMVVMWHRGQVPGLLKDNLIKFFHVEPRLKLDLSRHPLLQTEPHGQEPHRGQAESDRP